MQRTSGISRLQTPRDAHERSACAQRGDKMGHCAAGLLDDLRRRRVVVRLPVRVIAVLIRIKVAVRIAS